MVKITMEGEGDTVIEALYDLSLNAKDAIKRARAANEDTAGDGSEVGP